MENTASGLNTQKYKLAATGAGVIVCQQLSPTSFRALASRRAAVVGRGLGITGGGFVENIAIYEKEIGFIVETAAEAWREATEENPGFDAVISLEQFLERAQSIATLHVRVGDESGVHGTSFYALTVTDAEWERIASLSESEEREGALVEVQCDFAVPFASRPTAHEQISLYSEELGHITTTAFYHAHELRTFGQIAWHAQTGRLWGPQ